MKKVKRKNDNVYNLVEFRIMNEEIKLKTRIIYGEIQRYFKYLPDDILQKAIYKALLSIDKAEGK